MEYQGLPGHDARGIWSVESDFCHIDHLIPWASLAGHSTDHTPTGITDRHSIGHSNRPLPQVGTVAADVCCKIVEARSASLPSLAPTFSSTSSSATHPSGPRSGGGAGGSNDSLWKDASRALAQQFPRFDTLDHGRPVTSSGVGKVWTMEGRCLMACIGGNHRIVWKADAFFTHTFTHACFQFLPLSGLHSGTMLLARGFPGGGGSVRGAGGGSGTSRGGGADNGHAASVMARG